MKNGLLKQVLRGMVRSVLPFYLFTFLPSSLAAQDFTVVRGDCMPVLNESDADGAHAMKAPRRLPAINASWDASRTYHQLVILITFKETRDTIPEPCLFKSSNPRELYDRMLNEDGYNQRNGPGCAAEYFREQSGGLFNLQFDVYGPYQVSTKAQPTAKPTDNTRNYGAGPMTEATKQFLAENPDIDFSQYDWNNNGYVNQVVYVFAGYSGNQSNENCYGYVWPNTSMFTAITTHDGKKISSYSNSCELWANGNSCGFGTICHEFTHSLGLPDIYPAHNGWATSVLDEWDLMDGGNFTNFGWCPPNYTPLEKMLLGWLTPVELTAPATIKNLKPVSEGGQAYIIKNTDKEYYLLENRQWIGWDVASPGRGLVIYHVNYDANAWSGNRVNDTSNKPNFDIVSADNMDYTAWNDYLIGTGTRTQYAASPRLHNLHLSTSPYPYAGDPVVDALTDTSVPAAVMYNANSKGDFLMSKPITNIQMTSDGLISFDFMGGDDTTGIEDLQISDLPFGSSDPNQIVDSKSVNSNFYDLQGRKAASQKGLLIVREKNGTVRKIIRQ